MNDELILFIGGTVTKDILKFKFFSVTPGDLGTPALNFMLIMYVSDSSVVCSVVVRSSFVLDQCSQSAFRFVGIVKTVLLIFH